MQLDDEAEQIASLRATHSLSNFFRHQVSNNSRTPNSFADATTSSLSTSPSADSLPLSNSVTKFKSLSSDPTSSSDDAFGIRSSLNAVLRRKEHSSLLDDDQAADKIRLAVNGDPQTHPYVLRPDMKLRHYWDMYIFVLLIYVATVSVFVLTFLGVLSTSSPLFWIERFIDLSFFVDIILNFFTAYERFGVLVTDPSAIRRHYATTWFVPDALGTFPWDVIAIAVQQTPGPHILQLPRFLRLVRLFKFFRLSRVLRLKQSITRLEVKLNVKYGYTRLAGLVATTLLIAHWFACFFFYFGSIGNIATSWISQEGVPTAEDRYGQYITALYFSVYTITTIGYGDVVPENTLERSYTTVIMLLGAACFAFIISQVSNIVSDLNLSTAEHRAQMDKLTDLAKYRQLPEQLVYDIRRFFQREFLRQRVADEKALLHGLSKDLRIKVLKHIYGTHVENSRLFKYVPIEHLDDVYEHLTEVHARKHERLYLERDYPECFYIILQGEVQLTGPNLSTITLGKGEIFGEHDIIFNRHRENSAVCTKFTDLITVPRFAVMRCLQRNPSALKKLRDEEALLLWERALSLVEQQIRFARMARSLRLRSSAFWREKDPEHHILSRASSAPLPSGSQDGTSSSPHNMLSSQSLPQAMSSAVTSTDDMDHKQATASEGLTTTVEKVLSWKGMQNELEEKNRRVEDLEAKLQDLQNQLKLIAEGLSGNMEIQS